MQLREDVLDTNALHLRDQTVGLPEGSELNDFFHIMHSVPTKAQAWNCDQCGRKTTVVYERWDNLGRMICFKCMWREGVERWQNRTRKT